MKRFNVTNLTNQMQFQVEGLSLEAIYPDGLPPEWGESPEIIETDLTAIYAAEAARKALESAKLDALRLMAKKNTLTASEVIQAVPMVLKMLFSEGAPTDLASEIIQQELES